MPLVFFRMVDHLLAAQVDRVPAVDYILDGQAYFLIAPAYRQIFLSHTALPCLILILPGLDLTLNINLRSFLYKLLYDLGNFFHFRIFAGITEKDYFIYIHDYAI